MTNSSDLPTIDDLLKKTGYYPQKHQYNDDNEGEGARAKELKNDNEELKIYLRKKYAKKFFNLIKYWIIFIGIIILLKGWRLFNFYVDNKIIYTLLGVSTITIIAPTNNFSKYIFNTPKEK